MPFQYPYTNFHELNLDWIVSKMQELEARFTTEIVARIKAVMAKAFVSIAYDADTESITFDINVEE